MLHVIAAHPSEGAGIVGSVGVACRLRSGQSGFQIPEGVGEFFSPKRQSLPFLFLGVERPCRVANHSPSSNAVVKNDLQMTLDLLMTSDN
jgi:hypothetical protein